jgi:hypothetical protein
MIENSRNRIFMRVEKGKSGDLLLARRRMETSPGRDVLKQKIKILPSSCILIFFILFCGCNTSTKNENIINGNDSIIAPVPTIDSIYHKKTSYECENIRIDSTINAILVLRDSESVEQFYSNYKNILYNDSIRDHPIVILTNQSSTQYLLTYKYEGDVVNSFSCFEMGFTKDENFNNLKQFKTKYEDFKSETGIHLNMSLNELISIKGKNYTVEKNGKDTLIVYRTDNTLSSFVKRHYMATYFMEYTIKNDKIHKIYFGFDYP